MKITRKKVAFKSTAVVPIVRIPLIDQLVKSVVLDPLWICGLAAGEAYFGVNVYPDSDYA